MGDLGPAPARPARVDDPRSRAVAVGQRLLWRDAAHGVVYRLGIGSVSARRWHVAGSPSVFFVLAALVGCSVEGSAAGGGGGAGGTGGAGAGGTSGDAASSSGAGVEQRRCVSSAGSGGSCTGPSSPALPRLSPARSRRASPEGAARRRCRKGPRSRRMRDDCQRLLCDGRGAQVAVAADEPEDDHNPCTSDTCVGTTPRHTAPVGVLSNT